MGEPGFSQLKEEDGEKLRSRSWHGQFRELIWKYIIHNLTQAANQGLAACSSFSGRIQEKRRRHHRNNGTRYYSFDSSAIAVTGNYCIF